MLTGEVIVLTLVAYILGSVVSFSIGRSMGIKVGSLLTFDLFVRLGYVKYNVDERGEVVLEQITASKQEVDY